MTGFDRTGRDVTRPDETGHDATRRDKTRQQRLLASGLRIGDSALSGNYYHATRRDLTRLD